MLLLQSQTTLNTGAPASLDPFSNGSFANMNVTAAGTISTDINLYPSFSSSLQELHADTPYSSDDLSSESYPPPPNAYDTAVLPPPLGNAVAVSTNQMCVTVNGNSNGSGGGGGG
ncbi:hypothetical protein Ahia01_000986300, partial [Argonauta hians]